MDKGTLRAYLAKTTGFSRAQITRLIAQYLTHGNIRDRRGAPAQPFARRYTSADVELLVEIDTLHDTLSGPATRKLCERALHVFGDQRFAQLAQISNGHLYNLRHGSGYQRQRSNVPATMHVPPSPLSLPLLSQVAVTALPICL